MEFVDDRMGLLADFWRIIRWLLDILRLFVDYWYFHGKEKEEKEENWDIYITAQRASSPKFGVLYVHATRIRVLQFHLLVGKVLVSLG